MADEWRRFEVHDLIAEGKLFIGDGYRAKNEELSSSGLPFARAGNINDGFRFEGADYFPEESLPRAGNKVSRPGDVVFTSKGTVGRFGFVREGTPRFVYSPQLCFWRSLDHKFIFPRFLYYWMFSREFFVQFKGVAAQTDMAEYVSLTDQRQMRITLPPLFEQLAITHVLGTLDDKIALNRQTNETLEAIARAIFKSWFVHFDPVRAKDEGRQPAGMPAETAALFPNTFAASELEEIPTGWHIASVTDLAEINARTLTRADPLETIDYVEISAVMRGEVTEIVRYKRGTEPSRARRRVRHGDTILSTVRPDRGACFLCLNPSETLVVSTGFAVLSPRDDNWAFLYCAATRREMGEKLGQLADGGAYPAIRPEVIGSLSLVVPTEPSLLSTFQRFAGPFLECRARHSMQSKTLAALRDILLPKLLSGEIRVREAEKAVERVV